MDYDELLASIMDLLREDESLDAQGLHRVLMEAIASDEGLLRDVADEQCARAIDEAIATHRRSNLCLHRSKAM